MAQHHYDMIQKNRQLSFNNNNILQDFLEEAYIVIKSY